MLWRALLLRMLFLVIIGCVVPMTSYAQPATPHRSPEYPTTKLADFPTVQPDYIYDQLAYLTSHFQHREAGYDTNLPPDVNGHDEFAQYWSQEMLRNLQGFGAQVRRDPFAIQGWQRRPAKTAAFNVEVSVPGASHPEQVIVIGCHYDGEAISTQSANDDASGCAIELGVARAMATFWRNHHAYPARTLRFLLFDAEEQGLFGSFHYVNTTVDGDLSNIVAMFNEEQSGIAYPLRYLGQLANPLLPMYIDLSPLKSNALYPAQNKLSPTQRDQIANFRTLMQQAVPAVFQQFQALGYLGLTYHGPHNQDIAEPVFTADQEHNVIQEDDVLGGSDQIPFTLAGVPSATFVGNSTYYDDQPPAWSYPFDQKADTLQLMNTFADGSSQKSYALTLALALPGMLTTWMLHQPTILGETPASSMGTGPIVAIGDIGQTAEGQAIAFDASSSFVPGVPFTPLTYSWDFGDNSSASGMTVSHAYTTAGSYTLTLIVSSAGGTHRVSKIIRVVARSTSYQNPYASFPADGSPPANRQVKLPAPNDNLADKVISTPVTAGTPTAPSTPTSPFAGWGGIRTFLPLIAGVIMLLLVGIGAWFALRHRHQA